MPAPKRSSRSLYVLQCRHAWITRVALLVVAIASASRVAFAQEQFSLWDITKHVVVDPTTYTPSVLAYASQRLDWDSSQPFFQHGDTEHNPEYTISGRPDDIPISHEAGNARILHRSFTVLENSFIHNVSSQVLERILISRHPEHRRLIEALGLMERISVAAYASYQMSASHFNQWQVNNQLARQRGYR